MYSVENYRFWRAHSVHVVLGMVVLGCPVGPISDDSLWDGYL